VKAAPPPPDGRYIPLLWQGSVFDRSGYSEETRCLVYACAQRRLRLALRDWPAFGTEAQVVLDPQRRRILEDALTVATPSPPFVDALHKTILPASRATLYPEAGPTVLRTMFETDSLPLGWAKHVNRFDRVWVPSDFNVSTFREAGVAAEKLRTLPQTLDFELIRAAKQDAPLPLPEPGRSTRFLSVFEFSERKGWRTLLDAWCDAFKRDDDVALIIKCSGIVLGVTDAPARVASYLAGRRAAPVIVLDEPLSSYDLARLYCACNAFVLPTRGEGWGRPLMEAMALGLPTVGSRWGGNLAFMNDDNSFLVPGDLATIDANELVFDRYLGQRWFAPDRAALANLLRVVADDGPEIRRRAQNAAVEIAERFSHERTVERLAFLTYEALEG
jgi:glycosyltransferase involved in cell wall biosynthesis